MQNGTIIKHIRNSSLYVAAKHKLHKKYKKLQTKNKKHRINNPRLEFALGDVIHIKYNSKIYL